MRYWSRVAATRTERDSNKQKLETTIGVRPDSDMANAMFAGDPGVKEAGIAGKGTEDALNLLSNLAASSTAPAPKGALA